MIDRTPQTANKVNYYYCLFYELLIRGGFIFLKLSQKGWAIRPKNNIIIFWGISAMMLFLRISQNTEKCLFLYNINSNQHSNVALPPLDLIAATLDNVCDFTRRSAAVISLSAMFVVAVRNGTMLLREQDIHFF